MADAWHLFGGDLSVAASGDVTAANGAAEGQQRVLRRLLTNPGDYLWNPTYGAGLGRFVGEPTDLARITGVIRAQIFREAAVARRPEPVIDARPGPDGSVYVSIQYADAATAQTRLVEFSVGGPT